MKNPAILNNCSEAAAFLDSLNLAAMTLGLDRIAALMGALGNPQERYPTLHIAGTNGKGSVSAMLTAILKAAGNTVGTFTSPHLIDVRERIGLNGDPIPEDDFAREVLALKAHLASSATPPEEWPTYFEFLNALAFNWFHKQQVDIAVVEVGLGGRLDSTNILQAPAVTVITSIGLDHQDRLGETLEAIAFEKAGILKPGRPVVIGPGMATGPLAVIQRQASAQAAPISAARESRFQLTALAPAGHQTLLDRETGERYELALLGAWQLENLATVLEVIRLLREQGFKIPEAAVREGLRTAQWPGRFQYFPERRLIIDGSHNPPGFASLKESLRLYFPDTPLWWLVSLRDNRAVAELADVMLSYPATQGALWTGGPKPFLYHPPEQAADITRRRFAEQSVRCPVLAEPDPRNAYRKLMRELSENPQAIGLITGSLYSAGVFMGLAGEPGNPRQS